MDQFPDQHHLASWAGMSPGNNESAGKRKSGTTAKGNRWLRATLGEVAGAAARTKRSYLSARYRRLAARRGHNRSVVTVGHKILTIVYFIIKDRVTYDDLGEDYYDRRRQEQLKRHHVKRLQRLWLQRRGHRSATRRVSHFRTRHEGRCTTIDAPA